MPQSSSPRSPIRRWLWAAGVLALLLCLAYWAALIWALQAGTKAALSPPEGTPWSVTAETAEQSLWPPAATIHAPQVFNLDTGAYWSADWARLELPPLAPLTARLLLPESEQKLALRGYLGHLWGSDLRAELALRMGLDVKQIHLSGRDITLGGAPERRIALSSADLSLQRQGDALYGFDINLKDLRPTQEMLAAAPAPLPDTLAPLVASGALRFAAPLKAQGPEPMLIAVQIDSATLAWGNMRLTLSGGASADDRGFATGQFRVVVENGAQMVALARDMGWIDAQMQDTATRMLRFMGGGQSRLELPLSLEDGLLRLGAIPLGPAPRFF